MRLLRSGLIVLRRLNQALSNAHARRMIRRSGLFDVAFYRQRNGLQHLGDGEALDHYLAVGAASGLPPHPLIDPACLGTPAPLGVRQPLAAYLLRGWRRGTRPNPIFDPAFYLRSNPDVRLSGEEPLTHYASRGWREGREPSATFDPSAYRARHALGSHVDPLGHALQHPAPDTLPATPAEPADPLTGLRPAPRSEGHPVDVVVPVFAGYGETMTALRRVIEARNLRPHELVVIDDASPDPAISGALAVLAERGLARVVRHGRNRGFVASANHGLRLHADRDVVLLNADTEVFDGWLDRLLAPAVGDVGTVTPLSNAATILSYPVRLRDNHAPIEIDDAGLDRLAAGLGEAVCDIPTAVGFCMLIRRACIEATGGVRRGDVRSRLRRGERFLPARGAGRISATSRPGRSSCATTAGDPSALRRRPASRPRSGPSSGCIPAIGGWWPTSSVAIRSGRCAGAWTRPVCVGLRPVRHSWSATVLPVGPARSSGSCRSTAGASACSGSRRTPSPRHPTFPRSIPQPPWMNSQACS